VELSEATGLKEREHYTSKVDRNFLGDLFAELPADRVLFTSIDHII